MAEQTDFSGDTGLPRAILTRFLYSQGKTLPMLMDDSSSGNLVIGIEMLKTASKKSVIPLLVFLIMQKTKVSL